jgi:hypothetical protein
MRRPTLIPVSVALAALALPAAAVAAPAKISPRASAVSNAGVTTVEVANPNAHELRGTATATAGKRTIAKRAVRLPKRSVTVVSLRLSPKALSAMSKAGLRATITLRLRRAGGRLTTSRRSLTLHKAAAPQPPGGDEPAPAPSVPPADPNQGGSAGGPPGPPVSARWVGRMGTEGPYDDLELTVMGGQIEIATTPFVPVSCFENGGSYRSSLSFELFDAPGPWTVGADGDVAKQGRAVNQLVSSGARTITYKVTNTTQEPGRVAGTLGMSFFDSKYDVFTSTITFVNCAGAQSFEAVPAG